MSKDKKDVVPWREQGCDKPFLLFMLFVFVVCTMLGFVVSGGLQ